MKRTVALYRGVGVEVLNVDLEAGTAEVALQDDPTTIGTVDAVKLKNVQTVEQK